MPIIIAHPHGFCAGVNRALKCLEKTLAKYGPPIYVYHEIVHNKVIVERFKKNGVFFVDNISSVPKGSVLLFSAHGVSPKVREEARNCKLLVIDATCPLVTKIHKKAAKLAKEGYSIFLIGHKGHDEVEGIIGEAPSSIFVIENVNDVNATNCRDKLAYLTQTTLSVDDTNEIINSLKKRFPNIIGPKEKDICYATHNRQKAIKAVLDKVDFALILGSKNSSNSRRLLEIAQKMGVRAILIDDVSEIDFSIFKGIKNILVTSSASSPEDILMTCISELSSRLAMRVEHFYFCEESVNFKLPSI